MSLKVYNNILNDRKFSFVFTEGSKSVTLYLNTGNLYFFCGGYIKYGSAICVVDHSYRDLKKNEEI